MTSRLRLTGVTAFGVLALLANGCIVIADGNWSFFGAKFWTSEQTETLAVSTAELKALEVRTHNGWVHVAGQADVGAEAKVTVNKKAGGASPSDAAKAMEALEVYAEPVRPGTYRLGYRWKGIKSPTWSARVNFDVQAPVELALDVETHNGEVEVTAIRGDVAVDTHNGDVNVTSSAGALKAETHNGRINATYAGSDVTLVSHNGRIAGNLGDCGAVRGTITTHNGAVEIAVGEKTAAELTCETHNGGITFDAPVATKKVSRRQFVGTLGAGGQPLEVTTHNGSIRVKKSTG